jgi:hypothetical protein
MKIRFYNSAKFNAMSEELAQPANHDQRLPKLRVTKFRTRGCRIILAITHWPQPQLQMAKTKA